MIILYARMTYILYLTTSVAQRLELWALGMEVPDSFPVRSNLKPKFSELFLVWLSGQRPGVLSHCSGIHT